MRIRILSSAVGDLHSGRRFYEKQGEGLSKRNQDRIIRTDDELRAEMQ